MTGVLELTAEFPLQRYDLYGRKDLNVFLDATWTKSLSNHVSVGVNANYMQKWSNSDSDYTKFEVGPFLTVSFGPD
jgi:hypothetical protein